MKLSFLYGAHTGTLLRLLWQQKFRIGLRYLPSFVVHLFVSLFHTIVGLPERLRTYATDPIRPIFLLGHWRCGTTHLHNLMTRDGIYHSPNTFDVAFPHMLLYSEKWLAPLLDLIGPGVRPQDNMAMLMSSVNEEEMAMACLGAPTPYLAIHFPRDSERYHSHLSFQRASKQDLDRWKRTYKAYVRKLVAKYGNSHPLMLKSPANTARIPLLLEMYPDARFIHIHRHPYETIRSTIHLYDKWFDMVHFQSLQALRKVRDEKVLEAYEETYRRWLEDKSLIPAGRLVEVCFEDLKKEPVKLVEQLYQRLGDGEMDREVLQEYLDSIANYQQNQYDALSSEMIQQINQRMGFVFDALDYPMELL